MDPVLEFFDLKKEFKKVILPGSQTQGYVVVNDPTVFRDPYNIQKDHKGHHYAKEYQEKEDLAMKEICQNLCYSEQPQNSLTEVEDLTSLVSVPNLVELDQESLTCVYDKYDFTSVEVKQLPIEAHKQKILDCIQAYQVTIIQGETGCGKTTQVPQYIIDESYSNNVPCNIIITQPRRIAAISVAKRVSEERSWPLGTLVGYQVGLNAKVSEDTRLTYCTTGVLLQKLIHSKHANNYTHIILDEVHERDQDTDFALIVIRYLIRRISRQTKLILMSATINVERFAEYFAITSAGASFFKAPVVNLDNAKLRNPFKINTYYLCQLHKLGSISEISLDSPGITTEGYHLAFKLIQQFDGLEKSENKKRKGAVLVFLPGINEIEELYKLLTTKAGDAFKWWVKPLHSTITTDEQSHVFHPPPEGHRKIILSTNIAESSITVPDIVYVIDFCLTKQLICDMNTNFTSLQVTWASKTNCIQRAGRSGRVADGRVYRLVPRDFYEHCLEKESTPEILRCPLERVILQAKLLDLCEPKALLGLAMDPPDLSNIENTILLLKEAGALLLTSNGVLTPHDGDITFMGRVMAKLPVDIRIAKLILFGHLFSVLEDCIIMGAAMSLKSVFSAPFQERMRAYHSKLVWADSSCSDSIAFLNAYKVWKHLKLTGFFNRSAGSSEKAWAKRNFIQIKAMHEVNELVDDLKLRLKRMDIEETMGEGRVIWDNVKKPLILKIALAGAFYPHYFVRGAQGGQVCEQEAVRQLVGRNPFSSVFLQGMPTNQPGRLYQKHLREALKSCSDEMKITFDGTSKVFVEFEHFTSQEYDTERNFIASIPGRVSLAVYRAVKLRQLKEPIKIPMLQPEIAKQLAEKLGINCMQNDLFTCSAKKLIKKTTLLPQIDVTYIPIKVSYVNDPSDFWAVTDDEVCMEFMVNIYKTLNSSKNLKPLQNPKVGTICVAPYQENETVAYYRARIKAIIPSKNNDHIARVFFIDYGNTEFVCVNDLQEFVTQNEQQKLLFESPGQAISCSLSEMKPSLHKNPRGIWSDESINAFKNSVLDKTFYGKIYSVVYGKVSLELITQRRNGENKSFNEYFIRKGYAESTEEMFVSKVNHQLRMQHSEMDSQQKLMLDEQEILYLNDDDQVTDPEPPALSDCRITTTLKGPYSPLEMKIYGLTRVGVRREVNIEWNSVNSVLLDTDPQDPHERLLVSACVGLNSQGDRLTLRHTTLMPNIHGLPALLSLIFAPTIELRVSEGKTRYTGALCGLGADEETSLFPDHDMEITFDTEITLKDIEHINKLRYWMSMALYTSPGSEVPNLGAQYILSCQNKIKEILYEKILCPSRKSVDIYIAPRPFMWNIVDKNDLLSPGEYADYDQAIYKLHWGVELKELDEETEKMLEHLKILEALATNNTQVDAIECKMCNVILRNSSSLKTHLESALHTSKEKVLLSKV